MPLRCTKPLGATPATPTAPPTGRKGHQVAINGFITWILVTMSLVVYFLWAFIPTSFLDMVLASYYPDKYWAVAIPAILVMTMVYYLTVHFLLMLYRTDPLTDGFCVAQTNGAVRHESIENLVDVEDGVPPITDIPVSVASRLLFQPWN
ncbi:hypothetical protein, conserved [Trypanosoma brucei gambiense DAL972]|uniref:PIG-P domain-containing protein n=2 Tax=Trypanosoma brucei TaxID=5691 RepID=Q389W6_TRYB2|nr:hypothetical protein, conserved [Trypanosoma brucei gambiense DAL972]XP_823232.1 hypothetical protein, conserved [Trypanosoma brucei brucei TREU927]EAN78404.1 hypothetical protein, conserved [Trypanosoma brucei brucei TREU927]CBH16139.1 hypothetical protein, conserved [Trypanosoma brucei gambiense DAL972]|eukprot:XP_011778403.1 hypothetical protein, conserved [Trypanosoma brucei gambiense DAL972]